MTAEFQQAILQRQAGKPADMSMMAQVFELSKRQKQYHDEMALVFPPGAQLHCCFLTAHSALSLLLSHLSLLLSYRSAHCWSTTGLQQQPSFSHRLVVILVLVVLVASWFQRASCCCCARKQQLTLLLLLCRKPQF